MCCWTGVLMQCSAAHVNLTGKRQNKMTENDKNEKITVFWLAAKVALAILMWFQFKWIDSFHCFLNGLQYKCLFCLRSPYSRWKIQQHYTGRSALRSFKIRPADHATSLWPIMVLCMLHMFPGKPEMPWNSLRNCPVRSLCIGAGRLHITWWDFSCSHACPWADVLTWLKRSVIRLKMINASN